MSVGGGRRIENVGWTCLDPTTGYRAIAGHDAFYAGLGRHGGLVSRPGHRATRDG